jgi:hypothetical protein
MNREERERLVDNVLDRALGPQMVEPRDQLEERILANLPAEPHERPWWQWMWIPALAAATVLAIVIGARVMHRETPPPQRANKTLASPTHQAAVKPESPVVRQVRQQPVISKRASHPKTEVAVAKVPNLPRQDVFPAPVPLTEQERLLLALVRGQRPQAELLAAEQQVQRERVQKYFETGEVPATQPTPAQPMR